MGKEKTALVLSAGGMFGAYQAGAYQAIAEYLQPDLVAGASVGALNGWPIAAGCSPETLISRWLDPSAGEALQLYPNCGWRNGWLDPAPLREQARRLYREFQPKIPMGVVVVEVPSFRRVLVQHPQVTADHLQATCSIPLFLPSVRIGSRRYLDGGLFEKLPIWAALEMGATKIVAIDSLPSVGPWWLRAGVNTVRFLKPKRQFPREPEVMLISPSEPLGEARDAIFWKRENMERWISLGRRDAARVLRSREAIRSGLRTPEVVESE